MKIVDFYIHVGCPPHFIPEPSLGKYRPDAYMKDAKGNPVCVEVQLTPISTKKMQQKIDQFVSEHGKEHDARIMLLVTNSNYDKVKMPQGFRLVKLPVPLEPYTERTPLSG